MKKVFAFVIFSHILGKKKFIADVSRRPDNRIVPAGYVDEPEAAHTWSIETEVVKAIGLILDRHERSFAYEKVMVPAGKQPKFSAQADIR